MKVARAKSTEVCFSGFRIFFGENLMECYLGVLFQFLRDGHLLSTSIGYHWVVCMYLLQQLHEQNSGYLRILDNSLPQYLHLSSFFSVM